MNKPQRQKETVGLWWLIWSGALTLVTLGGWATYVFVLNQPAPIVVRLIPVERGTVETTVNVSGTVQLRGQQTLKSPVEGAVDQVLVAPGDRVNTGKVLLILRNPERQTALADQQVKINRQELVLARNRQRIAETQQQLALEQERLQSLQTLAEAGAIAQTEVQDQETRMRTSLVALRTAEADTRTAVLDLESLQLERQRIQQELNNTVITSPLDGVILGVNVQDGDGVELRTELLTLGDPTEELVQLQLSTLNAVQVRVGQQTRVSVIGPNPEVFMGQVHHIYPQAVVPSINGSTSGDQSGQATVPTIVRLNSPTQTLIPGGQVNVEIILEQHRNVVTLPLEVIQRSQSDPFVWVLDDNNQVQRQPIAIGLEGLTTVEITSGLDTGDGVVLPPPEVSLQPGTAVTTEAEPDADSNPSPKSLSENRKPSFGDRF